MRDYADLLDKVESVLIPAYAQRPENPLKKSRQCWKTKPGWTARMRLAGVCRPGDTFFAGDGLYSVKTY
jgi:hypothetical protein